MSRLLLGLLLFTACCSLVLAGLTDEEDLLPHRLAKRRLVIRVPSMRNPDSDHLFRILNKMNFLDQKQKKLSEFYDGI